MILVKTSPSLLQGAAGKRSQQLTYSLFTAYLYYTITFYFLNLKELLFPTPSIFISTKSVL